MKKMSKKKDDMMCKDCGSSCSCGDCNDCGDMKMWMKKKAAMKVLAGIILIAFGLGYITLEMIGLLFGIGMILKGLMIWTKM